MKLKNKRTGEIGYTAVLRSKAIVVMDENAIQLGSYTSLAELNSEWEDYEEPKDYWWISPVDTDVVHCVEDVKDEMDQYNKEIGNYFETREEAELAVRKLKAWKRLKDKGFRFIGLGRDRHDTEDIKYEIELPTDIKGLGIIEDLNTCFGGEE